MATQLARKTPTATLPAVDNLFRSNAFGFPGDIWDNFNLLFDSIPTQQTNYPPHNIYRDGDSHVLEIAVAGYDKQDITAKTVGDVLIVSGSIENKDDNDDNTQYRGIARRSFEKRFKLVNQHVTDVTMHNGLLRITVTNDCEPETIHEIN